MTTIPEDMDEFVNWEAAAAEVGNIFNMSSQDVAVPPTDPNLDLDLVLENADDDDFGFFALEHFSGGPAPGIQAVDNPLDLVHDNQLTSAQEDWWYTPDAPCDSCILGGYQCKKMKEAGSSVYEHYCTSCVALRSECSFAKHLPATARLGPLELFPSENPWPTMGDHPRSVREDSGIADLLHSQNPWPAMGDHFGPVRDNDAMLAGLPATSTPDLLRTLTASTSADEPAAAVPPIKTTTAAKIGARFSRESVRILKNWLSTHTRHPYPSDEEKEMLQRQTGLNKTQITNWLANARRRGKIQAPRSTSPHPRSYSGAIDIPQRRGTPAPDGRVRHMNPLERWVDSPPENEPAEVTAIARAVASSSGASSSGLTSPYSFNFTDDGSGRSLCNASSASSLGTSHSSGGSFASAYSHASRGSFGSFGSFNRGRRRRRRRAGANPVEEKTSLAPASKTFQCTFCTETFRTKHDWQRHEKSLHLSLERWVCSPDGPVALNPETNQLCCVFCGEANPDQAHTEKHNHFQCQERSLEERTFYRKDHLNQHLRLVHDTKFSEWSMKTWKVATPEIRSRCGFCGCVLDSWKQRTEHLSEHFKGGTTMADWKGDWGFEAPVLEMVENSIPPCMNRPLNYPVDKLPKSNLW
ncbi:Homeobox protein 4 [Colletotrichum tanaceti]|uniref:Homeobox protein 4 n=1 Tax=Colletotrichum tanaceti TaxID=1306861 RepID=A0A4U6XPY0_9PEZI|nr:Homeobox protein 4 [Colletotrichum tanaceti]